MPPILFKLFKINLFFSKDQNTLKFIEDQCMYTGKKKNYPNVQPENFYVLTIT
jgi:hypothetical protein